MRSVNCCFTLCLILSILGCNKYNEDYFDDSLERFIEDNRLTYGFSGKENWEIYQIFEGIRDNSLDFTFKCTDRDTLKSLSLFVSKETDEVFIDSYIKNYPKNDFKVELVMKTDTFYCYQEKEGIKEFIIGEYNYRFTNFDLAPEELNYYIIYKDSLGKITGDQLPGLPGLSNELTDSLLKVKSRIN